MKAPWRRSARSAHGSLHELNITPLLDLVFVLLVIFIITTPQLSNSLEINLPSGKPPTPSPRAAPPKLHRLVVDEQGRPFLDGQPHTLPALREELRRLRAADPHLAVVLEGADEANYQRLIDVLDILQQLEIAKVGLATQTQAKP